MASQLLQKKEQQSVAWWHFQQFPARDSTPSSSVKPPITTLHYAKASRGRTRRVVLVLDGARCGLQLGRVRHQAALAVRRGAEHSLEAEAQH